MGKSNGKEVQEAQQRFKLSDQELKRHVNDFYAFANNNKLTLKKKNKIRKQDWLEEITSYGSHVSLEWAERLWYCFDVDRNGSLEIGEYIAMASLLDGAPLEEQLKASFRMCDINGDGVLTRDEIIEMLKVVYTFSEAVQFHRDSANDPITPEEMDDIIRVTNFVYEKADKDHVHRH
eukprot:TRINITY_DN1614_c0_g1_i2.p1 TRINITY_DN1614_c0_g1~~TRINITY_DN1614_c0_g1_i2.p1  ORF type:complete len:177 (-),score=41.93 TRINITY_DN1614_c0_g1_i2:466-996(-)